MKKILPLLALAIACLTLTGCLAVRSTSKADLTANTVRNSVTGISIFRDTSAIGAAYQGSDQFGTPNGTNYHRSRGVDIEELATKVSEQLEKSIKAGADIANPLP